MAEIGTGAGGTPVDQAAEQAAAAGVSALHGHGFLDNVVRFVTAPLRAAKDAVNWVWGGVRSLWFKLGDVLGALVDAAKDLWSGISWLARQAAGLATDVTSAIGWLLTHGIPDALHWLSGKLVTWVKAAIHAAVKALTVALNAATRFLHGLINKTLHYARAMARFLLSKINGLLHWVEKVGKRTADLVLHPTRLVTWILPHLIIPLLRFLLGQAAAVGGWLVKTAIHQLPAFAADLEDALAKLL